MVGTNFQTRRLLDKQAPSVAMQPESALAEDVAHDTDLSPFP
jgi:hypothetical protein